MAHGEFHRRQPAERHADDERRIRRKVCDHHGDVVGEVLGRVRVVVTPVRVAVTGQVDRENRPAQSERHRVPRVRVLSATVDEHDLGRSRYPTSAALTWRPRSCGMATSIRSTGGMSRRRGRTRRCSRRRTRTRRRRSSRTEHRLPCPDRTGRDPRADCYRVRFGGRRRESAADADQRRGRRRGRCSWSERPSCRIGARRGGRGRLRQRRGSTRERSSWSSRSSGSSQLNVGGGAPFSSGSISPSHTNTWSPMSIRSCRPSEMLERNADATM